LKLLLNEIRSVAGLSVIGPFLMKYALQLWICNGDDGRLDPLSQAADVAVRFERFDGVGRTTELIDIFGRQKRHNKLNGAFALQTEERGTTLSDHVGVRIADQ
jgi:hypothetical protein